MASTGAAEGDRRRELLRRVAVQGRLLNLATTSLSHAAAARLGLQAVDQQCIGLLHRTGPASVGELAQLAGLTASSITGVVDRLERAGHVRREPDPRDRRKVIVVPLPSPTAEEMFAPLQRRIAELNDRHSDAELTLVADYLEQVTALMQEHAAALRAERPAKAP
ncbi:MarR family winged helix-turn-helix transcriptional regulator [Pseudonocardia nigra]|uniref:MarR family winged helix-turn-helix transcriptional regulator n=1 Tax=Pseudonocardia nigra TaxID=1921578 RepID=UPI001C5E24D6|nr:MarR family transcriptional regulator [Pseudonocardia nigra]